MYISLIKIGKAIKKLRCDKPLLLFSNFVSELESPLHINGSIKQLQAIYPDKGKSCIASNEIDTTSNDNISNANSYDIQVIIPVYNSAHTICRAIDSVLSQNRRFRVLITIINDGSTDESGQILNNYANNPEIEIITQENKGHSGARNRALKCIKGRYITFLDSDDYLPQNALISMYDAAEKNRSDIVQGSYYSVIGNKKTLIEMPQSATNGTMKGFPWGKLFKANIFENLSFPEGYWFEDTLMSAVIFPITPKEKKTSISMPVYCYVHNSNSITSNARKFIRVLDTIYVINQLYKDRIELGFPPRTEEYEQFLRQTIINLDRVNSYGNKEITRLAFCTMQDLKKKYFPTVEPPKSQLKYFHKAFNNGKLKQCMFLCGLL